MIPTDIKEIFAEIDRPSDIPAAEWNRILQYYYQDVWQGKGKLWKREKKKAHYDIQQLSDGFPLAYVTGIAYFYGRKYDVMPGVLIPRPETEELVEWVLEEAEEASKVLDIGCGSGCIGVSLKAQRSGLNLTAVDVSPIAIETTKKNASKLNTDIDVRKFDVLNPDKFPLGTNWDIIVSNPPYVLPSELAKSIKYEPELALLTSEDDPLLFYRHIESYAAANLGSRGRIFLELSEFYAEEILQLFQRSAWTDREIRRDLQGKKRMLRAIKAG